MATRFAVQVIPNRFPSDKFYGLSTALTIYILTCRAITYDGAPGRIRTLSLLIRRVLASGPAGAPAWVAIQWINHRFQSDNG